MPTASMVPLPLPEITEDARAVAAERGVAAFLVPVLEMTRRTFPRAALSLFVEEDHELPADRYLVVQADVTGLEAEALAVAQRQWSRELLAACPATLARNFRLGLAVT